VNDNTTRSADVRADEWLRALLSPSASQASSNKQKWQDSKAEPPAAEASPKHPDKSAV